MNTPSEMMSHADDLLYKFRMLAGSDDFDQAVIIIKDIHQLVNDATGFDRANETDDSTMALSYILDVQDTLVGNIPAIPKGNRSRTAQEARMHRVA